MAEKPEKFQVRVTVRPTTERSPGWDRLWRWLLGPVPDGATTAASPRPAEGDAQAPEESDPAQGSPAHL